MPAIGLTHTNVWE